MRKIKHSWTLLQMKWNSIEVRKTVLYKLWVKAEAWGMSNLSEISHVRMFLNLQSDLERMFMLHVGKQLVNFFPRLAFFNEFSNILRQLASSLGALWRRGDQSAPGSLLARYNKLSGCFTANRKISKANGAILILTTVRNQKHNWPMAEQEIEQRK